MQILGYIIVIASVFGAGYLAVETDLHWVIPSAIAIGGLILGGSMASKG